MPRPKVRPEDRQRASRACQACKVSKIRCDGRNPCVSCVKREQPDSCFYWGHDRRRRRQQQQSTSQVQNVNTSVESGMNDSSYGKVCVGEISSSSFLHFLRKTVKTYVGSVPFTDHERHQTKVEADITQQTNVIPSSTTEESYLILESYFESTSGILDLFTADEIDALIAERSLLLESTLQSFPQREDSAALDIALAIGTQVKEQTSKPDVANGYFCRGRQIAFEDMLTAQSVNTVRLFTLLSFYMLGACNRNAASMFLGIAARAAIVLNLHDSSTYSDLPEDEYWFRLRIWNSLRNYDIIASFILGRPKCLPHAYQSGTPSESFGQWTTHSTESPFSAVVKMCSQLEEIVDNLNRENILHVPTAETLLQRLRQWSRELHPNMRHFAAMSHANESPCLDFADRQALVGNMHVSCIYYFAVILITRPYLIAYLMSRLRGKAPDHLISDPDEASDVNIKNNKVSKLAQVCVGAAVYMVDMCRKARESDFTFGNLCLLQAWIFGAGLVLGFSMFAGEPRKDIENTFEGARDILAEIAPTSTQASLYYDILTTFSDAVSQYRKRVVSELRQTVQHYMDQILVITKPLSHTTQNPPGTICPGSMDDEFSSSVNRSNAFASVPDPVTDSTKGANALLQMADYGSSYTDWVDINDQSIEDFAPEIEPFDQLFYTVE